MYALTPDDEITSSEDMITLPEVRARLKVLRPFHVEDTRVAETAMTNPSIASYLTREEAEDHVAAHGEGVRVHLEVVEYAEESEELEALRELESDLTALRNGDHAAAVNEDYAETFVRDELEDIYGEEAVSAMDSYMDWDRYATDRAVDWGRTTYRGSDYYLVP